MAWENNVPLSTSHILSITDLSKADIELVLEAAADFKQNGPKPVLTGKLLASCFFEPSTRTRLSFETAVKRLGGQIVGFSDAGGTSAKKGETLSDSMKVIGRYADGIIIRHPQEGAARLASEVAGVPVFNGGDGANQHPSQTLLDLFSIQECQGKLDDLNIALVGDLKYGRTVHSLAQACAHYNIRFYFVAPPSLQMPEYILDYLKQHSVRFSMHADLAEVLPKCDVVYMTRMQKERFDPAEYASLCRQFQLSKSDLVDVKESMRVLHPLPRQAELNEDVDNTSHAYYFEQAENGVYVREAMMSLLLGGE